MATTSATAATTSAAAAALPGYNNVGLGGPDPEVIAAVEQRGNVVVFFDMVLGGEKTDGPADLGRIKLELFVKDCPKTCENFRQLCTGEFLKNEQPTGYLNSTFHRVIRGFVLQGGDFVNHDGTGKMSIYGPTFADENLTTHKHDRAGMLSMANSGKDSNGCQFFITLSAAPHLDGKHTVFGQVLGDMSMLTVRKCEAVPVNGTAPRIPLRVAQCGEL